MRQLWRDVKNHRLSAALFLVYWLAGWATTILITWSGGTAPLAVLLHLLTPVIAGGLVEWWRAPAREGLLVGRGHLAGGPLAAALVILADIALFFGAVGLEGLLRGTWQASSAAGWLFGWLAWSAIFGLIALVLGLLGALVGAMLTRVVARAGETRQAGHEDP